MLCRAKVNAKAIIAFTSTLLIILEQMLAHDNKIIPDDPYDIIVIGTSLTTAISVYLYPNQKSGGENNA